MNKVFSLIALAAVIAAIVVSDHTGLLKTLSSKIS